MTKENIEELAELSIKRMPSSFLKRAIEDIEYRIKTNTTTNLPFYIVERLIEWHFDCFNLIPNDLAVNINTLNTNENVKEKQII